MYQYVLFDLDGTLTDPQEGITNCVQYALDSFGIHHQPKEKLLKFIGPPLAESFMVYYNMDKEAARRAVQKYRERFTDIGIFENRLYEGTEKMLYDLKTAGRTLAVASSKPEVFVERILEHFHIKHYFDIVKGSFLDGRREIKSQVIEAVFEELPKGFEKSRLVMVGDRLHDVNGAKAVGVDCIGVSFGYGGRKELEDAGADAIVDSMEELKNYILNK